MLVPLGCTCVLVVWGPRGWSCMTHPCTAVAVAADVHARHVTHMHSCCSCCPHECQTGNTQAGQISCKCMEGYSRQGVLGHNTGSTATTPFYHHTVVAVHAALSSITPAQSTVLGIGSMSRHHSSAVHRMHSSREACKTPCTHSTVLKPVTQWATSAWTRWQSMTAACVCQGPTHSTMQHADSLSKQQAAATQTRSASPSQSRS
jgi:hypothetical protein